MLRDLQRFPITARLSAATIVSVLALSCSAATATPTPVTPTVSPSPAPTAAPTASPAESPSPSSAPSEAPTATPTATPTAMPTATTAPSPTADPLADWPGLADMLRELGLQPAELPTTSDATGDALSPAGRARDIGPDLDIVRVYAGWATLGTAAYGDGGPFDCLDPEVFCGLEPGELGGQEVVLAAMQTNGHIGFGSRRGAELTVALDRNGHENAPRDFTAAGYAGADLVVTALLDLEGIGTIEFVNNNFAKGQVPSRVRIVGDTALFVIGVLRAEQPVVRFVNQEDRWYCETGSSGEVECADPHPWERGQLDYAPAGTFMELDDSL